MNAFVALYPDDGAFMAQHRPPAIGCARVEPAYREILGMIRLDIDFDIDEVVLVSPTVAYARTRSAGTTTILANDAQVSEGNRERFVLVRADASRRLAHRASEVLSDIAAAIHGGAIDWPVEVYAMEDIAQAHDDMEHDRVAAKQVVLTRRG